MNNLTSRQRKLVYTISIVLLLIPIIWLGMPAGGAAGPAAEAGAGRLAELRTEYGLGESTLGDVEPSSATMNLVLLGMRGIAANMLWQNAIEQQKKKDWGKMRSSIDSIILLQPHFAQVWSFQGWNLAFNVSSVHDQVEDRWYWVKEGGKFTRRGVERNERDASLYSELGRIVGFKIGEADEWRYYRKFFQHDPNEEEFGGGPDPGIAQVDGDEFKDNYLAARRWYEKGNEVYRENPQRLRNMNSLIFRSKPGRAQFNSAEKMQRDGEFGERTRLAWDEAHRVWTEDLGRESFGSPAGEILLNATDDDIRRLAQQEQIDEKIKRKAINQAKSTINYEYWRVKALLEREAVTQRAHRELHEAKELFRRGNIAPSFIRATPATCSAVEEDESLTEVQQNVLRRLCTAAAPLPRTEFEAVGDLSNTVLADLEERRLLESVSKVQILLESAMAKFERFLGSSPLLENDRNAIEEALVAVLYWRMVHRLNERPIPTTGYPLEKVWNGHGEDAIADAQRVFMRETGLTRH